MLVLYFPIFNTFYTHDDFFHFAISQIKSPAEFINAFNIFVAPQNWGHYRPLSTQVVYFIIGTLFRFNPLVTHIFILALFFGVVYLVFIFINLLSQNRFVAYLATFFYATSATHFYHLYSIANQELVHAIFFLICVNSFTNFLLHQKRGLVIISWFAFLGSLLSKELSLILPLILLVIYGYFRLAGKTTVTIRKLVRIFIPFLGLVLSYIYCRSYYYGWAKGDSYIWNFSPLIILNSLFWYGLWSLNLPQMLVDFIGPGIKINPNLFIYWNREIIPIFIVFGIFILALLGILKFSWSKLKVGTNLYLFSLFWFGITLSPVVFLPWHKFTIYLTLPLVGVVLALSLLISEARQAKKIVPNIFIGSLIGSFLLLSFLTLNFTRRIDWLTRGASIAQNVYNYFMIHPDSFPRSATIVFYDQPEDNKLLYRPSSELKLILSDQNFFTVFFPSLSVKYLQSPLSTKDPAIIQFPARQFFK